MTSPALSSIDVPAAPETRLATTPLVRWAPFPAPDILSGDVRFEVGDCLFACVAFWLNATFGRTLFCAQRLRYCVAGALTWPDTAPVLDVILSELQVTANLSEPLTLEAAQRLVLRRDCWGCNGLLQVLTFFCSKLLRRRVGFVIVELDARGEVRLPVREVPETKGYDVACVLHYDILNREHRDNSHYRILGSRRGSLLFDPERERWLRRLEDLDVPPMGERLPSASLSAGDPVELLPPASGSDERGDERSDERGDERSDATLRGRRSSEGGSDDDLDLFDFEPEPAEDEEADEAANGSAWYMTFGI